MSRSAVARDVVCATAYTAWGRAVRLLRTCLLLHALWIATADRDTSGPGYFFCHSLHHRGRPHVSVVHADRARRASVQPVWVFPDRLKCVNISRISVSIKRNLLKNYLFATVSVINVTSAG